MNIITILQSLGWDIISCDHMKDIYIITQSQTRLDRMHEVKETFTVTINDLHFDENGNLYVKFISTKSRGFIDNYLHGGMDDSELYQIK